MVESPGSALVTRDGWKLVEIDPKADHYQPYQISDVNKERHELSAEYRQRMAQLKVLLDELAPPAR